MEELKVKRIFYGELVCVDEVKIDLNDGRSITIHPGDKIENIIQKFNLKQEKL